MKKDENVEGYAQNKLKGNKLWKKSKKTKSPTRKENLKEKAKLYYARMEGYENKLKNPGTQITNKETNFSVNLSKKTEVKNNNVQVLSNNSSKGSQKKPTEKPKKTNKKK